MILRDPYGPPPWWSSRWFYGALVVGLIVSARVCVEIARSMPVDYPRGGINPVDP